MHCLLAEAELASWLGNKHTAGRQKQDLSQLLCSLPSLLSPGFVLVLLTDLGFCQAADLDKKLMIIYQDPDTCPVFHPKQRPLGWGGWG